MVTSSVAQLRARVDGSVFTPADDGYAEAVATWETSVINSPPVVVVVASPKDVETTARWAFEHGLPISVQSTGHGALVPMTAGVLVNTSQMNGVEVDAPERRARFQSGARWSDVFAATTPHGLIGLAGGSAGVGVAGYTLGGGLSPLGRTFGFAVDWVTDFDVVLADGRAVQVDATTDAELFWALRGGGDGLGIVTSIGYTLIPLETLYGGGVYFDGDDAAQVLARYREWVTTLDERTSTSVALIHLPPIPELEQQIRGRFVVHLRIAHVDAESTDLDADGRRILSPMLAAGRVLLNYAGSMSPSELPNIHRDPVLPMSACYRGGYLHDLDGDAVDLLVASATPDAGPVPMMIEVRHLGGAMARQPAAPNCATGRNAAFQLWVTTPSDVSTLAELRALVDGIVDALDAHRDPGAQPSFLGRVAAPADLLACWSEQDAARLLAVKARVDPGNRFATGIRLP